MLCFPSRQRQVDTLSKAQWDIVPPPSSLAFLSQAVFSCFMNLPFLKPHSCITVMMLRV